MKRLALALVCLTLAAFGPATQAQDAAPPPTVTVASVIQDYTGAVTNSTTATAARTAAEKALADTQAAEKTAAATATDQASRLARALALSGPVVTSAPGGLVTVYELADDGTVRVLQPKSADLVNVPADAPATPPAPDPSPAPDPAPAPQAIRLRPAGPRIEPGRVAANPMVIRINAGGVKIDGPLPRR